MSVKHIKNSKKLQILGLSLVAIGLFVTLYFIREQFVYDTFHTEKTYLWLINIPALVGMFLLYISSHIDVNLHKPGSVILFLLPGAGFIPAIISMLLYGRTITFTGVYIIALFIPVYFIFIRLSDSVIKRWMPWFVLGINVILVIMAVHGAIDMTCNKCINKWLAQIFSHCQYFAAYAKGKGEDTRRFMSMFGTQLHTAYIANVFFTINTIARQKKIRFSMPVLLNALPTAIVLAFTGSKAAFLVFAGIFVLSVYNNWKLILGGVAGGAILYFIGVFDVLIERFIKKGISTKRFEHLYNYFTTSEYLPKFWVGYGDPEFGNTFKHFPAAFEFPVIMGAFNYGTIFSILFLCTPAVYIIIRLWKKKCIPYLLMWLLLYADTNTYSQLIQGLDHPWITWFTTMIIINMALYSDPELQTGDKSFGENKKEGDTGQSTASPLS